MARGRMQFLSQDDIKRIHEVSLRVLENVGIVVNSPSTVRLLEQYGARLAKDDGRIRIPEDVVKSALSSAPKSILLAAQDRNSDLRIPSDRTFVACSGEAAFVKDLTSGESRYSTSEDVRDFAIFVERLPQVDFMVMMVGALDQPAHLKNIVELKTCFEFTRKHIQTMPSTAEVASRMVKLGSMLAGGIDELEKRPLFSAIQCPVSPLTFEKGLTESQVEFAKANIPVVSMVATVAGLTSPATLSGTIAQVNAENLASLVISQASRKHAPWIYSSDSSAGDLRSGSIDYGAFETQLLRAGSGQMGRFYGFPTMVSGIFLESTAHSISSVHEGIPYMVIQSLVDSDLASGFGSVDRAAAASFEQLLVDAWVWNEAREFTRSFDSDGEAISFDTLKEGCLDKNYLNKRHTLSRFRREFISVTKPDAMLAGRQETGARGALLRKASEEAKRMLAEPKVPVITKNHSDLMERFLKELG